MSGISLTASMRSNLLSLQNISGQVSSTQNKLATGNKVNSAIDNPGSYYTALSLNNRADDLNALLDSMGQAVSTIKAATTALESAAGFLEQASAVATQALETAKIPSKSFFEEKVGENGAVVTTAQELKDAVAAGKETICVYGHIALGDISTTGGISLKENQKLVGVGYFGNYDTDADKFSSISATASVAKDMISITQNGCEVSDLSINYSNTNTTENIYTMRIVGNGIIADIGNVDIRADFGDSPYVKTAITSFSGAVVNIKNNLNIQTSGRNGYGLFSYTNAIVNISSGSRVNIQTEEYGSYGILTQANSITNIDFGSSVNIQTKGEKGYGMGAYNSATYNINGNISIMTENADGLISSSTSNNTINILSTAQIYFDTGKSEIFNGYNDGNGPNVVDIAAGAKLAFGKDGKTDWYKVKESKQDKNESTTTNNIIGADNIKEKLSVEETAAWELPKKIEEAGKEEAEKPDSAQYQEIINQYDSLIKDASYKGINLLQNDKLSVKFNETNTADLSVQGKDMSSQALGFKTFGWETQGDIAESLSEIASALKSIRNYSAELGNNYSIITTRQDFTESLINVLTEGADKLTLADMNEESANMLALQTRQQLAINSLSLASQASQSILKLF